MNITGRYYTPGQVALGCFLGAPLAGCWLMSRTYRAAEAPGKARASIVWGIVGTVALLVAAYVVPPSFPMTGVSVGVTVALFYMTKQLQAATIARLESGGGRKGSWWTVIGVGLSSLLVVFGIVTEVVPFFIAYAG